MTFKSKSKTISESSIIKLCHITNLMSTGVKMSELRGGGGGISHIRTFFLHLAYCFRTIAYCFMKLFPQKLSVSVSYKVCYYMRDSTVLFCHVTCYFQNLIFSHGRSSWLTFRWTFSELQSNLIHEDIHVDNN